jgi:hypothetical protein
MKRTIRLVTPTSVLATVVVSALWGVPVLASVYNLKVVTDASPDYHDMGSMIHSITSKWEKPA